MNRPGGGSTRFHERTVPAARDFGTWIALIAIITLVDALITLYGSGTGNIDIISHLFYIPIILTAYFYPRWGVEFSLVIGTLYILLNIPFTSDPIVISKIFLLSGIFVGVGGIVSLLSQSLSDEKKDTRRFLRPLRGDYLQYAGPTSPLPVATRNFFQLWDTLPTG